MNILDVTLRNLDSGFSETILQSQTFKISKPIPESSYFLGFVPLVSDDFNHHDKFANAQRLELQITFQVSGGDIVTESMQLKLIDKKTVAWVT